MGLLGSSFISSTGFSANIIIIFTLLEFFILSTPPFAVNGTKAVGNKNHILPEEAVMIGDREHDIIGAKGCGVESIGVTFGYGSVDELRNAGADHIAYQVEEIREIITA